MRFAARACASVAVARRTVYMDARMCQSSLRCGRCLKVVLGGYKQHVLQLAFATCELSEFYKAQAELKKHRI